MSGRPVSPELLERRVARDRLDVADVREDLADLAALEMADEVPGERAGVRLRLRDEVLRAVLADELDAGLGEHGELLDGTYLTAARICTPTGSRPVAAISDRTRSRFARTSFARMPRISSTTRARPAAR